MSNKKRKKRQHFSENHLHQKIVQLEKTLGEKQSYIEHLENVSEAYARLEELTTQELMEAERTIKAQEIIQDMMSSERMQAEKTIEAFETVERLSERERLDSEKTIEAQQRLIELAQTEKLEREKTIQAQESLIDYAQNEQLEKVQTIEAQEHLIELAEQENLQREELLRAHEHLQELQIHEQLENRQALEAYKRLEALSMMERREAEELIRAQEEISNLSIKELKSRDTALRNILVVNKNISSLLEEEDLLDKILKSLAVTLRASRGVLYIMEKDVLSPRIFFNIEERDLQKRTFDYPYSVIRKAQKTMKSILISQEEVVLGDEKGVISAICVPLIYEERLLGIIYLDVISESQGFRSMDLDVAEIFSSQAAISINNAYLYEKIKRQNHQLLRLYNLKNNFLSHVSEKLSDPVTQLVEKVSGLIETPPEELSDYEKPLKHSLMLSKKMHNTVTKVLKILELEKEVDDLFIDKIRFPDLIKEILSKHEEERVQKNVRFLVELSKDCEEYSGNRTVIRTIFDELISNAIFYNRNDGEASIRGFRRDDYLVFEFTDNGHGIKKADQEHVFDQFFRTESSPQMNQWGAGLGLYMVKTFIQFYQGEVSVESTYRKGTKFTITFLWHEQE